MNVFASGGENGVRVGREDIVLKSKDFVVVVDVADVVVVVADVADVVVVDVVVVAQRMKKVDLL